MAGDDAPSVSVYADDMPDAFSRKFHVHSEIVVKGLNTLRQADKLVDVCLIVEGKTFKAHRCVLAACSDYFSAMFLDPMLESQQKEIELKGVNARGMGLLLEYVYTSALPLDIENVEDVLATATHVQMKTVIEACSIFLESQIDMENCVVISTLADLYSLETLKKRSYRYLCARLDEFSQLPDLLNLSVNQWQHILEHNYAVDCTEDRLLEIAVKCNLALLAEPKYVEVMFSHFHWWKITLEEVNDMITNLSVPLEVNKESSKLELLHTYEGMLIHELIEHHHPDNDERKEYVPSSELVNTRGMELSLVKIGGFETHGLTNELSVYVPSCGKWEHLTEIPHIEQCHYGVAVLGNDLFVVGGSYDVCLKEYIHPFGFRYNPLKNQWKTIAPIQTDRCRFSLNAMGLNLYAVGGVCEPSDPETNIPTTNCELYDAISDRWEFLPFLPEGRSQHAGVVVESRLYISGGMDRSVLNSFWCFDVERQEWFKLENMPSPRADHMLVAFDNLIYACGGWYEDPNTETRVLVETIDVYDIKTNQWSVETINPMPRYYTAITAVKREIFFLGGLLASATFNRATETVQIYDLDTKVWKIDKNWSYPKDVWECSCAAIYVPHQRDIVVLPQQTEHRVDNSVIQSIQ